MSDANVAAVMRGLLQVWAEFDANLNRVPLIEKLYRGRLRLGDYQQFLCNHRQQVVEGSRWIARAASSIGNEHTELRSMFLRHAVSEHRDFHLLEKNYVASGGSLEVMLTTPKNIGTEALHAFMFHRASQPDPFDLLGAMFIIEGLGQKKASAWGREIMRQLKLPEDCVSFLLYHGENDGDHMKEFEAVLGSGILTLPGLGVSIVKTAKIVARLYCLQLEEMGNA